MYFRNTISHLMVVYVAVMISQVNIVISSIFDAPMVSTIENVDFESKQIMDIMTHSDGTVFVAVKFSIWRINLETSPPQKDRVVGGAAPQRARYRKDPQRPRGAYQEGFGTDAKFREIRSIFAMNDTHLLVTDTGNNCVRQVNLRTSSTSQYAGVCTNQGFRNGPRLEASFNKPWNSLIVRKTIYVTDKHNNAIRTIKDREVGTLAQGGAHIRQPTAMAKARHYLYVTMEHGIVEINLAGPRDQRKQQRLIVTRWTFASALLPISRGILLTADRELGNIQVVDIDENEVNDDVCIPQVGEILNKPLDGNLRSCKFVNVTTMELYKGEILIGEHGNKFIRRLNIPLLSNPGNRIRCPHDMNFAIAGEFTEVHWKPPAEDETGLQCIECPSTHHELQVDYEIEEQEYKYRYRYLDQQWGHEVGCRFKITITHDPELGEQETDPLVIGVSISSVLLFVLLLILVGGMIKMRNYQQNNSGNLKQDRDQSTLDNSVRYIKQDQFTPPAESDRLSNSPRIERMALQRQESNYEAIDSRSVLPEKYRNRDLPRPGLRIPTESVSSDVHDYDYADKKPGERPLSPTSQISQPNEYSVEPASPTPNKKTTDHPIVSRQQSGYIIFSVAEGKENPNTTIYE